MAEATPTPAAGERADCTCEPRLFEPCYVDALAARANEAQQRLAALEAALGEAKALSQRWLDEADALDRFAPNGFGMEGAGARRESITALRRHANELDAALRQGEDEGDTHGKGCRCPRADCTLRRLPIFNDPAIHEALLALEDDDQGQREGAGEKPVACPACESADIGGPRSDGAWECLRCGRGL